MILISQDLDQAYKSKHVVPISGGGNGGNNGNIHDMAIRIVKLQSDFDYMKSEINDIKVEVRDIKSYVRETEIGIRNDMKQMETSIRHDMYSHFKWSLGIQGSSFLFLFGMMAHGFKWF